MIHRLIPFPANLGQLSLYIRFLLSRRVFATCSQQEPYGVMEEEEGDDGEERVSVRGAGVKQEEEDVEERS